MTARYAHVDLEAAKASAREAALSRKTCEGCVLLRTHPRPMCAGEKSPHFRTVRDTYHDRCQWYAVRGQEGKQSAPTHEPPAKPDPKPHQRMKIVERDGQTRVVRA